MELITSITILVALITATIGTIYVIVTDAKLWREYEKLNRK